MAPYDGLFDALGLREWCDAGDTGKTTTSMADLLASTGKTEETGSGSL